MRAAQRYTGTIPEYLQPPVVKTWPKDGQGYTIWNGPDEKKYRTKPGDMSIWCGPSLAAAAPSRPHSPPQRPKHTPL